MQATKKPNMVSRLIVWYFPSGERWKKILAASAVISNSITGHPQSSHGWQWAEEARVDRQQIFRA